MKAENQDWVLLAGRILFTVVFFQSMHHHFGDFSGWVQNLQRYGVPYPTVGAVLADLTIVTSVILLLTGWYPKLAVFLLVVFILLAAGIGHRFWELQGAARAGQYANFTKNFSLIGGLMFYLVSGPGRFVVRRPW